MKNILTLLFVSCVYIASAQTSMDNIKKDRKFAEEAAKGGMLEVKLGQLAQTNALTPEVKTTGQQMVNDHGKANDELKSISAKKNISLPTSIDGKMQKRYDDLSKLNGKKFDKKYSKCMVKDHRKDICLFKKEARRGKDPELKSWANSKLPTLNNHLKMWKDACRASKK